MRLSTGKERQHIKLLNTLYTMKITVTIFSAIFGISSAEKLGNSRIDATINLSDSQRTGQSIESHPNSALQSDTRSMIRRSHTFTAAAIIDGQIIIIPYGDVSVQSTNMNIGEGGIAKIETGFASIVTGEQIYFNNGTLNLIRIPTDAHVISSILTKTGITIDQFIQLTGDFLPQHQLFEITPSIIFIDGIARNVSTGIMRIHTMEILQFLNPTDENITPSGSKEADQSFESHPHVALQSDTRPIYLMKHSFNSALIIDGQVIVFPYGEILFQAPVLSIGESIEIKIETGFATTGTGNPIQIDGGILNVIHLPTADAQAISRVLAKSGITLDQFIHLTGDILPKEAILEITPSVLSFGGINRNVNTGIMRCLLLEILQLLNPTDEGTQIPVINPDVEVITTQTVLVTETAAHVTQTLYEQVTLTKTSILDEYITLTSPVYNSFDLTITNFIKRTVTIPEEQVIRSPLAGSVVVNTIPVPSQSVLTVTNSITNYFVQTAVAESVSTIQHYSTNYSISTALVNNPITSTVVQTITNTRVATAYITSTVDSTLYTTTTVVITIDQVTENGTTQYY